jgi:hypothetical protein
MHIQEGCCASGSVVFAGLADAEAFFWRARTGCRQSTRAGLAADSYGSLDHIVCPFKADCLISRLPLASFLLLTDLPSMQF